MWNGAQFTTGRNVDLVIVTLASSSKMDAGSLGQFLPQISRISRVSEAGFEVDETILD